MTELYPLPGSDNERDTAAAINQMIDAELINNMLDFISKGTTLKEIYGISDQLMESIYAHAFALYNDKKFDDAQIVFQFLYTHDIYEAKYIMGLAAVHQQKKDYAKAAELYALAFELDKTNALALLYLGQCFLPLKEKEQAIRCFSQFLETDAKEIYRKQAAAYLTVLCPTQTVGEAHA